MEKFEGCTDGMESLDIFDTVILVRLGWLTVVDLTDGLVPILLQIRPTCQISNDPSERVAKVYTSSNCGKVLVW